MQLRLSLLNDFALLLSTSFLVCIKFLLTETYALTVTYSSVSTAFERLSLPSFTKQPRNMFTLESGNKEVLVYPRVSASSTQGNILFML